MISELRLQAVILNLPSYRSPDLAAPTLPAAQTPRVELMLTYSIALEDDDGTLLATSPDFPELTTFGIDREDALARAADALGVCRIYGN